MVSCALFSAFPVGAKGMIVPGRPVWRKLKFGITLCELLLFQIHPWPPVTTEERGCPKLTCSIPARQCALQYGPLYHGLPPAVTASPRELKQHTGAKWRRGSSEEGGKGPREWLPPVVYLWPQVVLRVVWVAYTGELLALGLVRGKLSSCFWLIAYMLPGSQDRWLQWREARQAPARAVVLSRQCFPCGKNALSRISVSGDSESPQHLHMWCFPWKS